MADLLLSTEELIVGLNVALKGPFPLVGESEVSRTTPKLLCDHRH